jgi:hypothetical protein
MRNDDHGAEVVKGGAKSNALPVVAPRSRDDTGEMGLTANQVVEIDQPAAELECSGRNVIFVLDPDLGSSAGAEKRPANGPGSGDDRLHQRGGGAERIEIRETIHFYRIADSLKI